MKKIHVYIILITTLMFAGCQNDEFFNIGDERAWLSISLNSLSNEIMTRAVSGDSEEKMISNAYVYIFNSAGDQVFSKLYENVNIEQTIRISEKDVTGGTNMTIAVVANFGTSNEVMDILLSDNIATKQELMGLESIMKGEYIERGTSFLMSGKLENVSLSNPINNITIPLRRVDSKIRFNILTGVKDGYPVMFTPTEWRVVSSPSKVLLMDDPTRKNVFSNEESNYFTTEWKNYESLATLPPDTPDGVVGTFAFYALENNLNAKKEIPTEGLTDSQRYALRDKQLKNEDGTNRPEFEYANDAGTYVELKGNVRYKINNSQNDLYADVKFMIHLGGGRGDVNNYSNIRNTSYTYNVTIMSVDEIIVEVETGVENRPGAEGDVVISQNIIDKLDAYNNVLNVDFNAASIDDQLTWEVNTPFSRGKASSNPKDFSWVLFRLSNKNANEYGTNFTRYLGDNGVYSDVLTSENIGTFVDRYLNDISNNTDLMLDIRQLTEVLKECKRRFITGGNHLFDRNSNIKFTAFIKEFYYDKNPENTSETVENGLWKRFVNVDKRVLNILTLPKTSPDGNSSTTIALYSLRQASIQTMYSKTALENFSAWGSQFYPNPAMSRTQFSGDKTSINTSSDGKENGRRNFVAFFPSQINWSNYINTGTWTNKDTYNYAKYKCLSLNRDINGDGAVQQDEIQWYLASINQLTDLWIGEESINPTTKLYEYDQWFLRNQHVVSSTVSQNNDPEVLWASEGSSIGRLKDAPRDFLYYRCVRNLGLPKNSSPVMNPDKVYIYEPPYKENGIAKNGWIDLRRLDSKSYRGFFTITELPDHELRDPRGYNKPFYKFEIKYEAHITTSKLSDIIIGNYRGQTWEEVRSRSQPNGLDPLCPKGWRVPNQRELALMYAVMTDINQDGKTLTAWPLIVKPKHQETNADHFCRTGFNKVWTQDRPGFSVNKGSQILYLLSGKEGGNGGARCVRDVK